MTDESKRDLRNPLRRLLGRYYNLVGLSVFLVGFALRMISIGKGGLAWQVAGDIGTFLAVAVAIPFIYDRLIRAEDRQLFLSDLGDVLDAKIRSYPNQKLAFRLHERGRRSIPDKVKFFKAAEHEVIELGTGLSTFSGYFKQRPSHEYKDHVRELLRRGIVFKCVAMDPDCDVAAKFTQDRGETEYLDTIRSSFKTLQTVRDEFKDLGLSGKFEIYVYSHVPYFHAVCVDGDEPSGRMYISPYIYATKRAEVPGFEFSKSEHPVMFEKYWTSVKKLLSDSRPL